MAVSISLQAPSLADPTTELFPRFDALKEYLEDENATAESAAVDVTASINGPVSATYPALDDDIAGGVSNLWGTIFAIVEQIPYDHPWQARLVALVAAIKTLPCPPHLDTASWAAKGHFPMWHGLPTFGREVYETFNAEGLLYDRSDLATPMSREHWVNYNAFLARISAAQIMDLSSSVEELFIHVLENDNTASMLNDNVPALAVWILYAGNITYERMAQRESGLRGERWRPGKGRLEDLMRDDTLHRNTRDWAAGAYEEMVRIEANMY